MTNSVSVFICVVININALFNTNILVHAVTHVIQKTEMVPKLLIKQQAFENSFFEHRYIDLSPQVLHIKFQK